MMLSIEYIFIPAFTICIITVFWGVCRTNHCVIIVSNSIHHFSIHCVSMLQIVKLSICITPV